MRTEFNELKADIADRGVMVPVEYDDAGNVLEGHHRERACAELGITDYPSIIRYGLSEDEKRLHIRKLNLARRHLSREQRNEVMRQMRAEGNSLREIADTVGVSPQTAMRQTDSVVPNGTPDTVTNTVTGTDGKSYPAIKPRKPVTLFIETAEQRQQATEPQTAERIINGSVKARNSLNISGTHVTHNSGCNEWYTPPAYLDAMRTVLGKIDLNPAMRLWLSRSTSRRPAAV